MTTEKKMALTLEYVHELTEKTRHGDKMIAETIGQIVGSVRDPGEEDFHGLAAGVTVAIMLLQEQNKVLKQQVSNLAALIADVDMGQHPND